jgi:hypothetical protein
MKRLLLVTVLTIILAGAWGSPGITGEMPYSLEKAERGFAIPSKERPSAGVVAADAVIGRPLGLATTIAGAGVFLVTLPMSLTSGSTREAGWGLVGHPGCWTFSRPFGHGMPECEEKGVFPGR